MILYGSLKNFLLWCVGVWLPMFTGWGMYEYGIDYSYCIAASSCIGVLGGYTIGILEDDDDAE